MDVDHIVLWVDDPKVSLDFYVDLLGFEPVRLKEYEEGSARFPSVRLNARTIFDLMDRSALLPLVRDFTGGGAEIGGQPINHVCMSTDEAAYNALCEKLKGAGVTLKSGGRDAFGAQGHAVESVYFNDPDGNVLELRYYQTSP